MAIERRPLGRTGTEVTILGYGAMELRGQPRGPAITDEAAGQVLNAVLDAGINLIDTSVDYGRSEELIYAFVNVRLDGFRYPHTIEPPIEIVKCGLDGCRVGRHIRRKASRLFGNTRSESGDAEAEDRENDQKRYCDRDRTRHELHHARAGKRPLDKFCKRVDQIGNKDAQYDHKEKIGQRRENSPEKIAEGQKEQNKKHYPHN